jgi:hypothetical protein
MGSLERNSLCALACVAVLAGCSVGNVTPATSTINVPAATPGAAPTDVAPAHARACWSSGDCDGLCMPKGATKEQSHAGEFLVRAMSLHDLVTRLADTSSSAQMKTTEQQVQEDLLSYARRAQGEVPPDAAPATDAQMQHAAWLQSGAAQAQWLIRAFAEGISNAPITTDTQKVQADIRGDGAGVQLDTVIGDLQTFLKDLDVVLAPVKNLIAVRMPNGSAPDLTTGAGALAHYLGPVAATLHGAMSGVRAFLDPSAIPQLQSELTGLSRALDLVGKDGNPGVCLESL